MGGWGTFARLPCERSEAWLCTQKFVSSAWSVALWLTEAQQHLARVQTRLDRHLEAFATLKQAHDVLQSPVLAQSVGSLGPWIHVSD